MHTIYCELIAGRTIFDGCFLLCGLAIQILVFCLTPSEPIMVVSGIAGIFSVLLCAQGKISTFFFGFLQVVTYIIIAYNQQLYAEVAINAFYFLSMIYGIFEWRKHYKKDATTQQTELQTRALTWLLRAVLLVIVVSLSWLTGFLLHQYSTDSDPYLDAFTTVPAILAQLLMVMGYSEQWVLWFLIDLGCTWLWLRAGNYSMAALYAFWCANCIYGYRHWTQTT